MSVIWLTNNGHCRYKMESYSSFLHKSHVFSHNKNMFQLFTQQQEPVALVLCRFSPLLNLTSTF